MVEAILDKVMELLQTDARLEPIDKWLKVNDLVLETVPVLSIRCRTVRFKKNTRETDRAKAKLVIYIAVDESESGGPPRKPDESGREYGERFLRELALSARRILAENYALGGAAVSSQVGRIKFRTADEREDLHIARIALDAIFYAPRQQPLTVPTVEKITMDVKGES